MFRIVKKERLNPTVTKMVIDAPFIAKKAEPGQFIILRALEDSERIPLTIADYDREGGTITIIYQIVGGSTMELDTLEEGQCLHDFVGPLGVATHTDGLKKVAVVGGGVGCAIALPVTKKLHEQGCEVHAIVGFRNKDLVILEDEFKAASSKMVMMTDDGSHGEKGLVTAALERLIQEGNEYDEVIAGHDEIRLRRDEEIQREDRRFHEPDHDRRHGHVRRLPPDRRRRNEVRLRGRPGLRRPSGRFRRGHEARHDVPRL